MNLIEQDSGLYKVKFFIHISGKVFENCIIKIKNREITLEKNYTGKYKYLKNCIIFPSIVNSHTHLELTDVDKTKLNFSSFVEWIISIIKIKREKDINFFLQSYKNGKKLLNRCKIYAFGNILSPGLFNLIPSREKIYNFVEIIEYNEDNIENVNLNYPKISPHSFYSVHPKLIEKILKLNVPLSIHFFESKDEYEYLMENRGEIPDKLYKFTNLKPLKYNLEYFENFLNSVKKIQLVHLSNLPEKLYPLILKRKNEISYTLCPRSNEKFGFKSPYYFFIKNEIPFSLGTDSLCSNDDLNVLNEAKFILEDLKSYISIERLSEILFNALTINGYKSIFVDRPTYVYIENYDSKKFSYATLLTQILEHNNHQIFPRIP